ncbi:MAG: hypothetical protein RL258_336, partial [Pseudomonadota bacterium]
HQMPHVPRPDEQQQARFGENELAYPIKSRQAEPRGDEQQKGKPKLRRMGHGKR